MINLENIKTALVSLAKRFWQRIQQEPVIVRTALVWAVSAGFLELSNAQIDTAQAVVSTVVLLLGAVSARRVVSPVPVEERPRPLRRNRNGGSGNGKKS